MMIVEEKTRKTKKRKKENTEWQDWWRLKKNKKNKSKDWMNEWIEQSTRRQEIREREC